MSYIVVNFILIPRFIPIAFHHSVPRFIPIPFRHSVPRFIPIPFRHSVLRFIPIPFHLSVPFHHSVIPVPRLIPTPISPHTLAFFMAYMFDWDYVPATVSTYVSAIGYSHKLLHLFDSTKVFYIIQMLKLRLWETGLLHK